MLFAPDFCICFFLCLSIRLYWLIKKKKDKIVKYDLYIQTSIFLHSPFVTLGWPLIK